MATTVPLSLPIPVLRTRNQLNYSICKLLYISVIFLCFITDILVQQTRSFQWLLDASHAPTASGQVGTHPLFKNTASSLKLISPTSISMSYSTLANVARYEPTIYFHSVYEWLYGFASFPILNPETARRLVSYYTFLGLQQIFTSFLVCELDLGNSELCLLSRCGVSG